MKQGILSLLLVLMATPCRADEQAPQSWPELTQKPYEDLPTPDLGLQPLLLTAEGQKIDTKQAWEKQRRLLRAAWLERLGQPPDKPKSLDWGRDEQRLAASEDYCWYSWPEQAESMKRLIVPIAPNRMRYRHQIRAAHAAQRSKRWHAASVPPLTPLRCVRGSERVVCAVGSDHPP